METGQGTWVGVRDTDGVGGRLRGNKDKKTEFPDEGKEGREEGKWLLHKNEAGIPSLNPG